MWLRLPVSAFKECYLKKPVGTLSRQIFTHQPTPSLLFHASPLACFGATVGNRDKETINETLPTTETQKQRQRLLCAVLSLIKDSYFFKKTPLPFFFYFSTPSKCPLKHHGVSLQLWQLPLKLRLKQHCKGLETSRQQVCLCVFPRLRVRSQSSVHLCENGHQWSAWETVFRVL